MARDKDGNNFVRKAQPVGANGGQPLIRTEEFVTAVSSAIADSPRRPILIRTLAKDFHVSHSMMQQTVHNDLDGGEDGAPGHREHRVQVWLRNHFGPARFSDKDTLPTSSPDLNQMDYIIWTSWFVF